MGICFSEDKKQKEFIYQALTLWYEYSLLKFESHRLLDIPFKDLPELIQTHLSTSISLTCEVIIGHTNNRILFHGRYVTVDSTLMQMLVWLSSQHTTSTNYEKKKIETTLNQLLFIFQKSKHYKNIASFLVKIIRNLNSGEKKEESLLSSSSSDTKQDLSQCFYDIKQLKTPLSRSDPLPIPLEKPKPIPSFYTPEHSVVQET